MRKKRILALALCACMCLTLLPTVALADEPTAAGADFVDAVNSVVAGEAPVNGTSSRGVVATDWTKYLNERFYAAVDGTASNGDTPPIWSPKWNLTSGAPKWDGAEDTNTVSSSATDSTTNVMTVTYDVNSGGQLLYALKQCVLSAKTTINIININSDIDLNGQGGKRWNGIDLGEHNVTINGNEHTIYNLCAIGGNENGARKYYASLICSVNGDFTMRDLTFDYANLCDKEGFTDSGYSYAAAIVGRATSSNTATKDDKILFENVDVKNSLSVSCMYAGGMFGRFDGEYTPKTDYKCIKNCGSESNISFGKYHIGSLAASCKQFNQIVNCYSVGSTVISTDGHSGGLFACIDSVDLIQNCFVDAEVYGTNMTGTFTGALGAQGNANPLHIISCYSSGFVEGQKTLGGFVGMTTLNVNFYDCYSTALVGLRSSGVCLGGFVGNTMPDSAGDILNYYQIAHFYNCYAAGEVGSTDTDCSIGNGISNVELDEENARIVAKGAVGGFAGYIRSGGSTEFACCYYDKQTTAMREWGIGNDNQRTGLSGVLTTATDKSGAGLMSTPGTTGYVGMTADPTNKTYSYYSTGNPYPAAELRWDYGSADHYPELKVFSDADASNWGDERTAALVREYSAASTAGPQLETWDKVLTENTGKIDNTAGVKVLTYDTVRDIVNGFLLTSSAQVSVWDRIGMADSNTTDGAKVKIRGDNYDVLSLKHQNNQWLCDELVTGIEWLKVSCQTAVIDGNGDPVLDTQTGEALTVTATRRLRVIPTSAISAGESKVITDSLYDHADDVTLLFSTAKRMATPTVALDPNVNTYDVTTGIFPDREGEISTGVTANALTAAQNTYGVNSHGIETTDSGENDKYIVDVGNMGIAGENAYGSTLYTYLYEVERIDNDGEIIVGSMPIDFTVNNPADGTSTFGAQFNGYAKLPNVDKQYLVAYAWKLSDGRTLMDAKLIRTAKVPFTVDMKVWSDAIDGTLCTSSGTYAGATAYTSSNPTASGESTYSADAYTDAYTAFTLSSGYSLDSLKLTLDFSGVKYSADMDLATKTVSVPFVVYRIVYRNGVYYTIPEKVFRTYTLNENNGVYSLDFTKDVSVKTYENDNNSEAESIDTKRTVLLDDVECNIRVDAVTSYTAPSNPSTPSRPNVSVTKASTHTINGADNRITYTLTAKNSGDGTAYGIRVKDYVPEYTHFSSVDSAGKYGIQNEKEYVSWFIASLAPGASRSMTFTVTVDDCADGTVIYNSGLFETTGTTTNNKPDTDDPAQATNTTGDIVDGSQGGTVSAVLTKVDSKDQATALSGARFRLYRTTAGGTEELIGTYSTDLNGQISVIGLDAGSYYWQEIGSPACYKLDDTKHSFTVTDGKTTNITVTNTRSDVPEWLNGIDHYAYIIGYPDGYVRPAANITRAEVATIFFRLLTDEVRDQYITKENSYSDVKDTDWFCHAVSTMSAMGIVNGYPDGTFNPNGPITRAEFAAVAARFDQNGNTTTACFSDIYDHWGMKEISIAANNGWVLGYEDGTFRPDQLITRAEAMAMTNRVLQRVPEFDSDLLNNMVKWPDNEDVTKWYYLYVQEATNSHYLTRKLNGYETWTDLRQVRDWTEFER